MNQKQRLFTKKKKKTEYSASNKPRNTKTHTNLLRNPQTKKHYNTVKSTTSNPKNNIYINNIYPYKQINTFKTYIKSCTTLSTSG